MSSFNGKISIPLVHESRGFTGKGILNSRQQAWVSAASNDFTVENPVFYKHKSKEEKIKKSLIAQQEELLSVQGLPSDFQESNGSSADVIEKLQESRKERHESAFEDMVQELAVINMELEPQVQEICQTIKNYLEEDLCEIEEIFKKIEDVEVLITYTMTDLGNLWEQAVRHFPTRMEWVRELSDAMNQTERNRIVPISEVFKSYTAILERIAHFMPADVHRLMENEVLNINRSLLMNKKATAELIAKLMTANVDLQRKYFIQWQNLVEVWKSVKLERAIQSHVAYMSSEGITDSSAIRRLQDDLIRNQKSINGKRLEVLKQLRDMKPPASTKTAVYQWNRAITSMTNDLDQLNEQHISNVRIEQWKILQDCNSYIQKLKIDLETQGIVDKDIIEQLMHDVFLPLFGERKATFDVDIEKMEKHMSEVAADQKQNLKALFVYCQGCARIWDNHELGLAKEERALQELQDNNRVDHDYENQIKEAKLDIVIDRMRQDSTGQALASSLLEVLAMLEVIKIGYLEFHSLQKTTCEKYPSMIKEELRRYGASLCHYFNVIDTKDSNLKLEQRKIIKVISLSSGSTYNLYEAQESSTTMSTEKIDETSKTFITDFDDDVEKEVLPYIDGFSLPVDLYTELKDNLCREFLEHFEMWNNEAVRRAENVTVTKIEETNNELDLRFHLHEPRPGRAEKDVYNIRMAELSLHQNRVEEHCIAIASSLEALKKTYQEMLYSHSHENDRFRKSVEELEASFHNAVNTNDLKSVQDEVDGKLDQFMEVIRASVRQFRRNLDDVLNKLRNSNAQFRRSLKIFSEGGNFSPEEVEDFRKKLERIAKKIDQCEGNLMGELEGMETKRVEIAKEFAGKLEDRFKYHLFDLTFIEKIKRWLTNIQVKIKAEVANSNSQSHYLNKMLSVFKRRLDLIKNPSVDDNFQQKYTVEELHDTLVPILTKLRERLMYLNCAKNKEPLPSFNSLAESLKSQPVEVKEKLPHKTNRGKKGSKKSNVTKKNQPGSLSNTPNVQVSQPVPEVKSPTHSPIKKEAAEKEESTDPNILQINSSDPSTSQGFRRNSGVRTSLGGKYDRKFQVFGDPNQEHSGTHFHALNLKVLQYGLDGLLSTAELYYRQNRHRSPTRPRSINESFDACAESIIQRLKKYKQQTEAYHNECLQEFRVQIKQFGIYIEELPSLLMVSMVTKYQTSLHKIHDELKLTLTKKKKFSEKLKKEHQTLLRPTLGHPNNKPELMNLKSLEQSRQQDNDKTLKDYERLMTESENIHAKKFLEELIKLVTLLMAQFDLSLTLDEVIEGDSKPKLKSEKELIREKMNSSEKQENDNVKEQSENPRTWPSLDASMQDLNIIDEQVLETPVRSLKSTNAHGAVVDARDKQVERYFEVRSKNLKVLSETCAQMKEEDERWKNNWDTSLYKILQLY